MDKWDIRFMKMAYLISEWSSCFKANRAIGAVIVKDKRIMTTGYNGAPAGITTCKERGECLRQKLGIPSGTRAEACYAIHAEQNAILQAARLGISIDGGTLTLNAYVLTEETQTTKLIDTMTLTKETGKAKPTYTGDNSTSELDYALTVIPSFLNLAKYTFISWLPKTLIFLPKILYYVIKTDTF